MVKMDFSDVTNGVVCKAQSLSDMFVMQKKFQEDLGNNIYSKDYKKETALALFVEIGEFMNEVDWKSWKKNHKEDVAKLKEELIDCWIFFINMTLPFMSIDEVYEEYNKKHQKNLDRQKENY